MMKTKQILAAVFFLGAGFVGGTFITLRYPDLLQTTLPGQTLYEMLQQGTIDIGTHTGDLVLPESIAQHERGDPRGHTVITSIYQQQGQILLLETVDDRVSEVTLWKSGYRAPDLYLARSDGS